MLNRQSRISFSVLLIISILLHGLAWWWVDIKELFKPAPPEGSSTVQITLQQPPKPPSPHQEKTAPQKESPSKEKQQEEKEQEKKQEKKQEIVQEAAPKEEQHLPMHNSDTFASSNNTDKDVTQWKPDQRVGKDDADVLGDKQKEKKKESTKASKTERLKKERIASTKKAKEQKAENKDPEPGKNDSDSEKKSKQVYSENKSDILKMQNIYLVKLTQQVIDNLIVPDRVGVKGNGAIKFSLNSEGYLLEAKIVKSIGDYFLDLAMLEAIKRVHRFEVPADRRIVKKYYSHLTFSYSETDFVK